MAVDHYRYSRTLHTHRFCQSPLFPLASCNPKQLVLHGLQPSTHCSQTTRHRSCSSVSALLYYVQVNNGVWISGASSLMTFGLNLYFHYKFVYPAKTFSGLGCVPRWLVMRSPTISLFEVWSKLYGLWSWNPVVTILQQTAI